MSDADLLAQYNARVGAGVVDAAEDMRRIEGEMDVRSNKGVCVKVVSQNTLNAYHYSQR